MSRGSHSEGLRALCAAALIVLLAHCPALALQPGDPAPPFAVRSERGGFSSRDIAGRVAVITCEARGTVEDNRPFKREVLARWRQGDSAGPAIVPVINCFSFIGLVQSICKNRVAAAAGKENLAIYTDDDGAMFRDFGIDIDASTIVIVDRRGITRYVHAGRLDAAGVRGAVQLIERLLKE